MLPLVAMLELSYVLPLRTRVTMCTPAPPPSEMRVKDLKAELDRLGVAWRGVCFEKEDLVRSLEEARLAPPPPAPSPPPPSPPPPPPPPAWPPANVGGRLGGFGDAVAQAEAEAAEVNAMSVEAIEAELAELGVDASAAAGDKAKLVGELLNARAFNRPQFDTSQFEGFGNAN